MTRHFQILISENMPSNLPANTLIINEFSKIQNLLGQEFETILFDARKGIHLEALAIAAGTLKMNGALIVLLSNWEKLHSQIDEDSLRWSGCLRQLRRQDLLHILSIVFINMVFPSLPSK